MTAFLGTSAYFFDYRLTVGNLGIAYAWTEISFALANAVLFGTYVAMASYRFRTFGGFRRKETGIAALGAFFSALVAGCPACAPTLASALGLFSVVSAFPGGGLGLKAVGALLLAYSVSKTYRELDSCPVSR